MPRIRKGTTRRSGRGSKQEHERIVRETLILLGREAFKLGRFFENPTGVAYRDHSWGREWISYGVKGSPDIYGIILGGRYVGIEIKSGNAIQQDNQVKFQAMVRSFGGFYFVCRSSADALEAVLKAVSS